MRQDSLGITQAVHQPKEAHFQSVGTGEVLAAQVALSLGATVVAHMQKEKDAAAVGQEAVVAYLLSNELCRFAEAKPEIAQ